MACTAGNADTVESNLSKNAMEKLNFLTEFMTVSEKYPEHLAEAIQYWSLDREGWCG